MNKTFLVIAIGTIAAALWYFNRAPQSSDASTEVSGMVKVDGSSTVFPITEAIAEEFQKSHPKVRVTVGVSGTGGGFKKFLLNEIDINNASRIIKQSEIDQAAQKQIEAIELPIAYDGLSVVINPKNDFIDTLTIEQLHQLWKPGSSVQTWKDLRSDWPDKKITLYGPGSDSGTFDYFTKTVNGKTGAIRPDFTASEDDNVLVHGVSGDLYSLGYFGFAYYLENQDKLKIVKIDGGNGAVAPSTKTINNGTYKPLSRPIFVYVNKVAAENPIVETFVHYYIDHVGQIAPEVGYVPLPDEIYQLVKQRFEQRVVGSVFAQSKNEGLSLKDILQIGS